MGRRTKTQRADARRNIEKVRLAYQQVAADLGNVKIHEISRGNLYRRIAEKTGLSTKVIAYDLNR